MPLCGAAATDCPLQLTQRCRCCWWKTLHKDQAIAESCGEHQGQTCCCERGRPGTPGSGLGCQRAASRAQKVCERGRPSQGVRARGRTSTDLRRGRSALVPMCRPVRESTFCREGALAVSGCSSNGDNAGSDEGGLRPAASPPAPATAGNLSTRPVGSQRHRPIGACHDLSLRHSSAKPAPAQSPAPPLGVSHALRFGFGGSGGGAPSAAPAPAAGGFAWAQLNGRRALDCSDRSEVAVGLPCDEGPSAQRGLCCATP